MCGEEESKKSRREVKAQVFHDEIMTPRVGQRL